MRVSGAHRAAATQLAHQQRTQAAQAAASALRGERPALLRLPVTHDAAAEQLLAAEAMLKAQPSLEAAKCAHVEALILCRAYGAALEACTRLQPDSVDGAYLKAEAQWRSGNLEAASATLQAPHVQRVGSGKCTALASFLEQLAVRCVARAKRRCLLLRRACLCLGRQTMQRLATRRSRLPRTASCSVTTPCRARTCRRGGPDDVVFRREGVLTRARTRHCCCAGVLRRRRTARARLPTWMRRWRCTLATWRRWCSGHTCTAPPATPTAVSLTCGRRTSWLRRRVAVRDACCGGRRSDASRARRVCSGRERGKRCKALPRLRCVAAPRGPPPRRLARLAARMRRRCRAATGCWV